MLIPSNLSCGITMIPSLSRRVNANSQRNGIMGVLVSKLIKKGEC